MVQFGGTRRESWWVRWVWLAALGLVGAIVVFLVIWANMRLARYLSVRYASFSTVPEDQAVAQVRQAVSTRVRTLEWAAAIGAVVILGLECPHGATWFCSS